MAVNGSGIATPPGRRGQGRLKVTPATAGARRAGQRPVPVSGRHGVVAACDVVVNEIHFVFETALPVGVCRASPPPTCPELVEGGLPPVLILGSGCVSRPSPFLILSSDCVSRPSPFLVLGSGCASGPSPFLILNSGCASGPSPLLILSSDCVSRRVSKDARRSWLLRYAAGAATQDEVRYAAGAATQDEDGRTAGATRSRTLNRLRPTGWLPP